MDFQLSEKQADLRHQIRVFAEKEITPYISRMEEKEEYPLELIKKMGREGWLGLPIPKQCGGRGKDFLSYILAVEEISRVSAVIGVIVSVHVSVGTYPILLYGTEEQISNYVPKLASGEYIGAFALTEPHAGSDAGGIRCRARLEEDAYILEGSKIFITNAGYADTYIAFAVTDSTKRSKGISAFIVEKDTPGLQVGVSEKKMGLHGSSTCELIFDQAHVPAKNLLGNEGEGFAIAKSNLDGGRIGISAQALGIAQATMDYLLNEMESGSSSVIRNQIRSRYLHLQAQLETARLLVYRAAYLKDQGLSCTSEASMAKMYASDTAVKVTTEAIQLMGTEGYLKRTPLERYFRDAKITQIYEGTNEIHRIIIGNQLLKKFA